LGDGNPTSDPSAATTGPGFTGGTTVSGTVVWTNNGA
jgi:hypothetical protein